MSEITLASEAVHEVGHAVMARYLGLGLKRIWINRAKESGRAFMLCPGAMSQEKELLILAAAWGCMKAFGIDTLSDQGGLGDETQISNVLTEMFPDDDDIALCCRVARLDAEVKGFFDRHDVRAAARALAEILTRTNEIDGPQAEAIIDRHLISGKANA